MRAVILVGGFGTRLRPLTLTIPKQMLPVVEVPAIERKIAQLASCGITDIVLSMGYRPDAFREAYPDNVCAGANLTYVVESEPLGTAGAIAFAAREAGIDDTFLAFNGDTLTDIDIMGLIELHKSRGAKGTISLTPVDDPSRFGVVPTDAQGKVEAFIEKPAAGEAPTNLINAGSYVLEPDFISRVRVHDQVSIEREIFPTMVEEGSLYAGAFDKYWLDIGTPESYLKGNMDYLNFDNGGEAFVAPSAKTGDNFVATRSVVGAGVTIGDNVSINESVVLPGAIIDEGTVIDRSIVGEESHIGAGSKLANLTVVGGHLKVAAGSALDGERVSPPEVEV